MRHTFHLHAILADTRARIATVALFLFFGGVLFFSLFTSPALTVALVVGATLFFLTWMQPKYVLLGLLAYLPFEPFLLKWIPDSVYVFARYGSELLIYLMCASVLVRMIWQEKTWKKTVCDIPFLFFALAILASAVVNVVDIPVALLGARQLLRFILLFFVVVQLAPSIAWIKSLVVILMVIAGIQSILGAMQAGTGGALDAFLLPSERRTLGNLQLTEGTNQFWDPGQRVFGTMGRYDQLGIFLALVFLLTIALLYDARIALKHKRLFLFLLAGGIPVLALTYSRSAWFGFLAGFLFFALVIKRDRRVAAAAIFAPLFMCAYIFGSNILVHTLTDTPEQTLAERFFEAFSYERWRGEYIGLGRVYWIAETVLTVVPASPVFGFGPGQYGGGAVAALGNTRVYDELGLPFGVYGTGGYIDNNWMSMWGELGAVGMGAFLWFYVGIFLLCVRTALHHEDRDVRAIAGATAAILVAYSLNAFLATFFEVRTMAPYVWVLSGWVVSRVKS